MPFDEVHASRSETPDRSETSSIALAIFQESNPTSSDSCERTANRNESTVHGLQVRKRERGETPTRSRSSSPDNSVEQRIKQREVNNHASHRTTSAWLSSFDRSESLPAYRIPLLIERRKLQMQELKKAIDEGDEDCKEMLLQQLFTPDDLCSENIKSSGEIISSYISMRQSQIEVLKKAFKEFKERILTSLLQQEEIDFSDESARIRLKLEQQEKYIESLVQDLHELEIETEGAEVTQVFYPDDHDMTAGSTSNHPDLDDRDNLATRIHLFQIQVIQQSYEDSKDRILRKLLNQEEVFVDEKVELERLKVQVTQLI